MNLSCDVAMSNRNELDIMDHRLVKVCEGEASCYAALARGMFLKLSPQLVQSKEWLAEVLRSACLACQQHVPRHLPALLSLPREIRLSCFALAHALHAAL